MLVCSTMELELYICKNLHKPTFEKSEEIQQQWSHLFELQQTLYEIGLAELTSCWE